MGLIFNKSDDDSYVKERVELLENFLKLSEREYLFHDFNTKLVDKPTPESLRKDLIIMTSLLEGVTNIKLKDELYHQIISDLVLLVCAGYEQ